MLRLSALTAIAVASLPLLLPATASASRPQKQRPRVTYVLRGHVTQYIAPAGSTIGSISLIVTSCNRNAEELQGMAVTFAITRQTRLVLGADGRLAPGERAVVKIRAPKRLLSSDLAAVSANEVVSPGVSAH